MFLSGFFLLKKNIWEKGRFFDKNHGQNVDFFDFARISLFGSKKHSLLSRIKKNVSFWLFWLKKNVRKRLIFYKHHGLTPLQNVDFFQLFENFTFEVQKALVPIPTFKKCFFLAFLAKKKHTRKRSIFRQKPCTNPFAKCRFFSTVWELHFWGPKSLIFYLEYQKIFLSGFLAKKKNI